MNPFLRMIVTFYWRNVLSLLCHNIWLKNWASILENWSLRFIPNMLLIDWSICFIDNLSKSKHMNCKTIFLRVNIALKYIYIFFIDINSFPNDMLTKYQQKAATAIFNLFFWQCVREWLFNSVTLCAYEFHCTFILLSCLFWLFALLTAKGPRLKK